jgi:hypothetical protein
VEVDSQPIPAVDDIELDLDRLGGFVVCFGGILIKGQQAFFGCWPVTRTKPVR